MASKNIPKNDPEEGNVCEDSLNKIMERVQNLNLNEKKIVNERNNIIIPIWLKDCESVFIWHTFQVRGLGSEQVIARSLEKIDELKLEETDDSDVPIQLFISYLKLAFEYYVVGNEDESWKRMNEVEELLEKVLTRDPPDETYLKIKLSLGHVISASKAHLLALCGEEEKSQKISKNIIPVKVMGTHDQAALCAMKSRYFVYSGYENGEEVAVGYAKEALTFEPENPEWKYVLSKVLRQQRKDNPFSGEIPREELMLLEEAVKCDRNTKYMVYLGQVYSECGAKAFKQYRSLPNFYKSELNGTINSMFEKALKLFKDAYELKPNSPSCLRRVGYGIMNLPKRYADYDFALQCLEKSLELSWNLITVHMLGTFYHKYGNDNKKALEYYERSAKAGSNAGLSDVIRVKHFMDPDNYDPCEDLLSCLKWEQKKKVRTNFLVQLGSWYLFIKRDFIKSLEYFNQVIADDKDSPHMHKSKCYFLRMHDPVNMYEYLANEALLLLQKNKDSQNVHSSDTGCNLDEEEDALACEEETPATKHIGVVEDLIDKISEIHPELMEMTPDPTLIDKLCQRSQEIKIEQSRKKNWNNDRNRFRSNQRGRGEYNDRGSGNYRGRGGWRGNRGSFDNNSGRRGMFSSNDHRDRSKTHDNSEPHEISGDGQHYHDSSSDKMQKFSSPKDRGVEENLQRRGRFSVENQRDKDRSENQHYWRAKPQQNRRPQNDKGNANKSDEETNWRKK